MNCPAAGVVTGRQVFKVLPFIKNTAFLRRS